jgi:type II secretory pathway component PulM
MKTFFMGRVLREKVLLLGFGLLVLIVWGVSLAGRTRIFWTEWRGLAAERASQQVWLDNRTDIEAKAKAATQRLDSKQTLDATKLVGELSKLATQAGLTADISGQSTQRTDKFAFNTVQVGFRRADMGALIKFYQELSKRSPYIALEQFSLTVDRATPGQLSASFRAVSVELAR